MLPCLYKDSYPARYLELSSRGLYIVEIAADFGVHYSTMDNWDVKFPEFQLARELGQVLRETWWVKKGRESLNEKFFQANTYKFMMQNGFSWSEKPSERKRKYSLPISPENIQKMLDSGEMQAEAAGKLTDVLKSFAAIQNGGNEDKMINVNINVRGDDDAEAQECTKP